MVLQVPIKLHCTIKTEFILLARISNSVDILKSMVPEQSCVQSVKDLSICGLLATDWPLNLMVSNPISLHFLYFH